VISILCAKKDSIYKSIPGLDVWDEDRDAYFFTGSNPVITHAPCAQWSRMKAFAKENKDEKELAYFCLKNVIRNGGIFEHPAGSSFYKEVGISKNVYSVDQSWWGFPARKTTHLFFQDCKPLAMPVLTNMPTKVITSSKRIPGRRVNGKDTATTVRSFAEWMINCIGV
jgi:hypothetical protein